MSTYMHLRCDAHDPPLFSEDVGQHHWDLPTIRQFIDNREALAREDMPLYDGTPRAHFDANARCFFKEHPHCPIAIEDEYGEEHPTEGETDADA